MKKIKRNIKLSFVVAALAVSASGEANGQTALPSRCDTSAVRKIQRPLDGQSESSTATFTYRFSVSEREDVNAPLLIFVPGGPGQTSMEAPLSYPFDFAVVRTDPRGMGCNIDSRIPVASYSSLTIARDILAIVREMKPKRYFIHGISFGTVPATMVASLAEAEGLPKPEAVILEGVMGRAFAPDEYIRGTLQNWKTLKSKLPSEVLNVVTQEEPPLGISRKNWAAWLSVAVGLGVLPHGEDFAYSELMNLAPSATNEAREGFLARMKPILAPPSEAKKLIYKEITCRELVGDVRDVKYDYDWVGGDLVATTDRLCGSMKMDRSYDSRKYQIPTLTYYFSGDADSVTPPQQARYHFENQTGERLLITVKQGGHQALSTNLMDCSNSFWTALLKRQPDQVVNSFASCRLKTAFEAGR